MNLDACSGLSLGIFTLTQDVPGKMDDPGVGSLQKTISPSLPVYCSNLIFVGLSLMLTTPAWVALVSAKSTDRMSEFFFMMARLS